MSLLTDKSIRQELRQALTEYYYCRTEYDSNVSPSIAWDASKDTKRGKIISIGSRIKKQRLAKQQRLKDEIKKLTRQQFGKKDTSKNLKEVRQQLDEVLTYKAEGALRYANSKCYEMGNKASRLLAFQLRKAQSSRFSSEFHLQKLGTLEPVRLRPTPLK